MAVEDENDGFTPAVDQGTFQDIMGAISTRVGAFASPIGNAITNALSQMTGQPPSFDTSPGGAVRAIDLEALGPGGAGDTFTSRLRSRTGQGFVGGGGGGFNTGPNIGGIPAGRSAALDITPEEFANLRGPLADTIRDLLTTGGGPEAQGPFAAPIGANEQAILDMLMQQVGGGALGGDVNRLLGETLQGKFLSPETNPFLGDLISALQRRETENFERVTLPRLRGEFTAAGQRVQPEGSSPFDKAAAMSTGDLLNRLSDISTQVSAGQFEQERGRQQAAIGLASQVSQQGITSAIEALQAQALPRLVEQLGIDKGLEEFRRRVGVLLDVLGTGVGAASPTAVVLPPGQRETGGGLDIGGLLGGLGSLASAFI